MNWFPEHPPIYDIKKTYLENVEKGPFFDGEIPERKWPPEEKWIDFLGHKVASPIGIPAGPLLSSNWIKLAARLGFDVLTYKTIRSGAHPAHPLPNMVFVDTQGQLSPKEGGAIRILPKPKENIEDLAVTNSFGMPSMSPEFLLEDIQKANNYLLPGQVMIVSVVGTPGREIGFLEDFIAAALLAKEGGAKIIEANFSCPNVAKKEGSLYMSPDIVYEFGKAIAKVIHPIPLIIKVGIFGSLEQMNDMLVKAAFAGVLGVCGINTIGRAVIDEKGNPALGAHRLTSGICGGPIRNAALEFIRNAAKINKKEKLDLTILGVGGVVLPEHFDLFLEAGAAIAMTGTAMMWDPYIGMQYHESKHKRAHS